MSAARIPDDGRLRVLRNPDEVYWWPGEGWRHEWYRWIESRSGTVVIGDEVNPPKPPVPPPDTGSFESRVKAAYGNDRSPTKAESLKKLIALYEVAQGAVPRASTLADLREDLKVASDALVPPGSLTEVRRLIGAEVMRVLGEDGTVRIDDPLKAKAVQLFQRIASVLQGVTG